MAYEPLTWKETARGVRLSGPHWQLSYDLLLGLFDLAAPAYPAFGIRWARARAAFRRGERSQAVGTDDGHMQTWQVLPVNDNRGRGLRLAVQCSSRRLPTLDFAATLYQDSPLLLLEIALHNTLDQPIAVEWLQPLELDPEWGGQLTLGSPIAGLYSAGWQSWSPAGWNPAAGRDRRTNLGPLFGPMHDTGAFHMPLPGIFRADLAGALTPLGDGPALLAGLLSSADQFGTLHARLRGKKPALGFTCAADGLPLAPEERLASERLALLLAPPGQDPLALYGAALGGEMEARLGGSSPRGWCSWPAFGQRVSEQDVLRQVAWLREHREDVPLEVVQVDDGWEQAVGDWTANERFPHGMAWLAEEIRRAGFTPGLWLAPFIAHPRSRLAQDHPEWILRDGHGRPASAGLSSVGVCHGLDLTRADVQEHLRRLVARVAPEWGYAYLKLDFLYGAALPGQRRRADLTRAQALRRGLEIVRQAAGPEAFLLGCGCPLGPAIGLVDAMRVGADVAPHWRPRQGALTPLVRSDPSFPGTANTVRNTLTRAWTHRRLWLNDPDPLILRRSGNRMSEAEVRSMTAVAALSGGSWVLGDDLAGLEAARQPLAAVALPPHGGRLRAVDVLERPVPAQVVLEQECPWGRGWTVGLFNWEDRPADLAFDPAGLGLPPDTLCHLHEFFSGAYRRLQGPVHFRRVEPHGCRVFLLRPVEECPQWVGSNLHLVQGQEVAAWKAGPARIAVTLDAGRSLHGYFLLWLPGRGEAPRATRPDARVEPAGEGLWRVQVRIDRPGPARVALR